MKNLHASSLPSNDEGRILVLTKDKNGDMEWINAAEFAQSTGITPWRYPVWLYSMYEIGAVAVAVSDRKTH